VKMMCLFSASRPSRATMIRKSTGRIAAGGAVALVASTAFMAAPSYAQTSVTVYGLIDAAVVYNNKVATGATTTGSSLGIASGTLQGSRVGFKGTEDLGGGLKAFFVAEAGFNVDTGASGQGGVLFGRTSTVGLAGSLGQVAVGRQPDFAYTNQAMFTSSSPVGFSTLVNSVHAMNLDRTEGSRLNNSIRYDTPATLGGFKGSAIYGMGEQAGNNSAGQSAGIAGQYAVGPFTVGLSYFQAKAAAAGGAVATVPSSDTGTVCANVAGHAGDTCLKTTTLVTGYQAGPMLLYASWSGVKQPLAGGSGGKVLGGSANEKINLFDVGMTYKVSGALKLLASVVQDRASFTNASSGRVIQYNLGADYVLSKRTDLYSLFGMQQTSDMIAPGIFGAPGADNSQSVFLVGMRHTF
jgi:predicted porin